MNLFFPNSDREGSRNMIEDTEQSAEMTTRKDKRWNKAPNYASPAEVFDTVKPCSRGNSLGPSIENKFHFM